MTFFGFAGIFLILVWPGNVSEHVKFLNLTRYVVEYNLVLISIIFFSNCLHARRRRSSTKKTLEAATLETRGKL